MTIKAVLFDIDGTLVDSNDMHVHSWSEAFRAAGQVFDDQTIHEQIGKGTDMLVPTLMPGIDEAEQERLGEAHGAMFKDQYLDQVLPFPGARDLLVRVHETGRRVVLASSASTEELEHYIELLDIRDIVAETTSADDVEHTKPAPDIFATALAKVAPLRPDEVIVVGDTPYDVEAAGKCGIQAIGLRSGGFSDGALRSAGAMMIYDDAAGLLASFDNSPLAK
jgi:membrane protein